MKLNGFFVTGTSTEIGKSVVSVALIGALKAMGYDVCGMKLVESGCDGPPVDGMRLLMASDVDEPIDKITPYQFTAPLAPLVAARKEGIQVEPSVIIKTARELASRHDLLVVEGVGGFLVPIAGDGYLVRDMARDMGLPVIIAAPLGLGTINHTLLTVESVRGAGLRLAGVALNQHEPPSGSEAEETNPALLKELLGDGVLLGELPYIKGASPTDVMSQGARHINVDILKRFL